MNTSPTSKDRRSVVQRSQKRARSATRGYTPKPEIRYTDYETGRVVSTWHKLSPVAEETVKDIQAQVNPKCTEYKEFMNILPINKKTNKKLGEGAYGEAYQTISTSTLKDKLKQDFGGIDNVVVKFQNLDFIVKDDDCAVKEIKNIAYDIGSTVCEDTSEVVIHTELVNDLCEPHNSDPFSVCFFKMFTYKICGKQIVSLTPLLAGGILSNVPPASTSDKQVNFNLINIAFALCVLKKSKTMHNDLKLDNIFLDDITSYDKCASRDIVYLSRSDSGRAAVPKLFPVFYLEYGSRRLYFKSEGLKHIPKIGDWGLACSYDKKIFNKNIIDGEFGEHSPDFYSPSSDFMFLLQCFCYYYRTINLYRSNKLIKYLYSILQDILLFKKYDIETSVMMFPVSFDYDDDFNEVLKKGSSRIGFQQIQIVDKIVENGLPGLLINCLLSFDDKILQRLGIYTNIPPGFEQKDCVCIGRDSGEHFKEYSIANAYSGEGAALINAVISKDKNEVYNMIVNSNNDYSVINAENSKGETALYHAIKNNDVLITQILLNSGADVNKKLDKLDTSYLIEAAKDTLVTITRLLLEKGADVNFQRKSDETTALMIAIKNGHIPYIELLLNNEAKDFFGKAIFLAFQYKQRDIVKLLIKYGFDINAKNEYGDNVLIMSISGDNIDLLKDIIDLGGDVNSVNVKDGGFVSALIIAAFLGKPDFVKLLIDHGADIHYKNAKGYNALDYAKRSKNNNQETVEILERAFAASAKSTTTPFWKQVMGF